MSDRPAPLSFGFLTVQTDASGSVGGYLVTNAWGRPLEFRLTSPVQPNRVQQILYGASLAEYVAADLIGKTLVEKTATTPGLIVTDSLEAVPVRGRVGIPVVSTVPVPGGEAVPLARGGNVYLAHPEDRAAVETLLHGLDPAVDPNEPFARVREALAEARKPGAVNRAA